ncbi:f78984c4-1909-4808-8479-3ca6319ef20c [Thermothielavioides terrestris]|nr:f78984c4-1909-4808-8479-3ca6319ef20c [Thermothielavioides terrestris]
MSPYGQQKSEDEHLKLLYRMPAPLPQDVAKEDKENNISSKIPAAAPTSIATKNRPPSAADEKVPAQIAPPATSASIKAAPKDNDNVLAAKPHNAPQRSAAPPPPPKMSVVETATTAAGASTAASKKKQFLFRVNGRMYTRLDTLGRGASSKVYRVSAENGKILALKRVSLEGLDDRTIKGYKGEIDLLKRLSGVNRVIQLIDHEFNEEKQMLSIVLEVGELDFLTFLRSRTSEDSKFDPVFVRYWWKEMVECVQAVHAKDIIHTDLKPQNFVIAQGRLKVIDFGIANAIQTDMTVNVHRDAQVGTPNYMSPESLMDFKEYALNSANQGSSGVPLLHRPKHFKLGKSCDVWSLGCILYQLVYGMGPFGHISNVVHRIHAIINFNHQINFPETTQDGVRVPPSLIRTMRRCLQRDQSLRPSCDELLSETDPFLYPLELSPSVFAAADHGDVLPITSDLLRDVIWNVVRRCRQGNVDENEALRLWPAAYWASCKKVLAGMNASGGGGNGRQA